MVSPVQSSMLFLPSDVNPLYGSAYKSCHARVKSYSQGGWWLFWKASAYSYGVCVLAIVNLGMLRSGRCLRKAALDSSKVVDGMMLALNTHTMMYQQVPMSLKGNQQMISRSNRVRSSGYCNKRKPTRWKDYLKRLEILDGRARSREVDSVRTY